MKYTYICEKWRDALVDKGLADFEAMWNVPLDTVDDTNVRRGGWSQAYIMPLCQDQGRSIKTIVKRHMNHMTHTVAHPIIGIPTLRREFHNIQRCSRLSIPAVEAVYYAERRGDGGHRAILVTEYLEGYVSLEDLVGQWHEHGWPEPIERTAVIEAMAHAVRELHRHRLRHGHLQPKHILIRPDRDRADARLIDLECMRRGPTRKWCRVRDLSTLNRRLKHCRNADRLRFALAYAQADRLDSRTKRMCNQILTRKKTAGHKDESAVHGTS